jgi:SAM-dependent methyltransferase
MGTYAAMQEILDEGCIGDFKLSKFSINKNNRSFRCPIPDGDYIRLIHKGNCVMSNTDMEKRTNMEFVRKANGDVLIAGLGIGLILLAIQDKEEVRSIMVIEKYPEVIELVEKQLPLNSKVKIIQGDVFEYDFPKGTKFDTIYFDIWNYINSDVYEEMKELKKRYRKYKRLSRDNENAYIACWAEYHAKHDLRLI